VGPQQDRADWCAAHAGRGQSAFFGGTAEAVPFHESFAGEAPAPHHAVALSFQPPSMSKWTRTRRDPGRSYTDEEKHERKRKFLARLHELVEAGIETEPEFVKAAKEAEPEISKEKLKELIRQFRAAVYERQQRDR